MVSFISSWAQQIIFAVVIGIIIQMLLPEDKSKKYIKVVIGVYVLFSVISPVVGKNIDLNLESFNLNITQNTNSFETNTQNDINDIYISNLKQDVILKLKNKGYGCKSIDINIEENYDISKLTINGIYEMKEEKEESKNDSKKGNANVSNINTVIVNEIKIGEKENTVKEQVVKGIPTSEEKKLKEYLSETYGVEEKNININ